MVSRAFALIWLGRQSEGKETMVGKVEAANRPGEKEEDGRLAPPSYLGGE